MLTNSIQKSIKLYRHQYEVFMMEVFGDYRITRKSMDLDGLLFKMKYMQKHNIDISDKLKEEFSNQSISLSESLVKYLYILMCKKLPLSTTLLIDILIIDMDMDQNYVTFNVMFVSDDKDYLQSIDDLFPDDGVYNIYPKKYFRFNTDSYNDGVAKAYPELFESREQDKIGTGDDKKIFVHSFTFQTGERCSLNCKYCYQFIKSEMKMDFEIAKEFIDHLLNDDYGYINRYNSPALIMEFIGGEPLLEITLTRKIYEYFLDRCYELNHPWFTMHRLSICSNGMQYFDEEVQEFFKEYASQISFNISIDGNKELHDSCRVQPNGEGSYDIDMMALRHYNKHFVAERNSKMTLAPSNISYLYESVVDFIKHGMTAININCVFEEGWKPKHAKIEYEQLKMLADYILANDLEYTYIAIFRDRQEDKMPITQDGAFCGGQGSMLALRPNGEFYPCLRYMPSSVGNDRDSMCIGTVKDGMDGRESGSEVLRKLDRITRRGQNTDICFECPLSNVCASCLALGHTVFNNPNKRTTFTCIMVIAESLSNVYYWNNMIVKHPEWDVHPRRIVIPDEWALLVIDKDELDLLKNLELLAMVTYMENHKT